MDKPLSMKRDEFCKSLEKLVNNSGLPAFMVAEILRDTFASAAKVAQRELEIETRAYYQALAEEQRAAAESKEPPEEEEPVEEVEEDA